MSKCAFLLLPLLTSVWTDPIEDQVICAGIFGTDRFKHYRNETNTCYIVWNLRRSYGQAKEQCKAWNSSLVIINDDKELDYVNSIRRPRSPNDNTPIDYWIGLETRSVDDNSDEMGWFWVDGTRYNGNSLVPGFSLTTDRCAMITDNKMFSWHIECKEFYHLICESPLIPSPTPVPKPKTSSTVSSSSTTTPITTTSSATTSPTSTSPTTTSPTTTSKTTTSKISASTTSASTTTSTTSAPLTRDAGATSPSPPGLTTESGSAASSAAPLKEEKPVISGPILYVIIGMSLLLVTVVACIIFIVFYMRYRRSESINRELPGLKTGNSTMTKATSLNRKQNSQLNNNYYNVGPSLAGPIGEKGDEKGASRDNSDENWSDGSGSEYTLTRHGRGPRNYANVDYEGQTGDYNDSTLNVRDKANGAYENVALSRDASNTAHNKPEQVQYSVPLAAEEVDDLDQVTIDHQDVGNDKYALVSLRRKSDKNRLDGKNAKHENNSSNAKKARASSYGTTMVDNVLYDS